MKVKTNVQFLKCQHSGCKDILINTHLPTSWSAMVGFDGKLEEISQILETFILGHANEALTTLCGGDFTDLNVALDLMSSREIATDAAALRRASCAAD